jgi:Na+-transporting NADH:ubiquinone oxidoreductase subunit NqrB
MSRKRKLLLWVMVAVLVGAHVALFTAGGSWRTLGLVLVGVDIVSGLFVVGALREFKKLDAGTDPK